MPVANQDAVRPGTAVLATPSAAGWLLRATLVALAFMLDPAIGGAQMVGGHEGHEAVGPSTVAHMRVTPPRPATPADSARAAAVVAALMPAIEKYRDVRVAESDGYRQFAPGLKNQRAYHFTNRRNAFLEHFRFDPAKPTSLLYEDRPNGQHMLVGAMYVAPKRASLEDLDGRIPLGIAQWHAHVDICLPKRGQRERWLERRDGQPLFGPAGRISTRPDCEEADGRFHEQLFGWMVHVTLPKTPGEAATWGHDHAPAVSEGGHQH